MKIIVLIGGLNAGKRMLHPGINYLRMLVDVVPKTGRMGTVKEEIYKSMWWRCGEEDVELFVHEELDCAGVLDELLDGYRPNPKPSAAQ